MLFEGLCSSILHPKVFLDPDDIYSAAGNQDDEIVHACQRYWIAEAIRYTHRDAVEKLFNDDCAAETAWPELPTIDRLAPRRTPHYGLGPILENEGTISGTYSVIDVVFMEQLGYDSKKDFDGRLQLVYGDQKTVSLIHAVQKK